MVVLMITFIIVWFILLITGLNNAKYKKNILLGVTLPYNAREDMYIMGLIKKYRVSFIVVMLIILLFLPLTLLSGSDGVFFTWLMLWLEVCIILPNLVYIYFHIKVKKYKINMQWVRDIPQRRVVDLKNTFVPKKKLSFVHFLPPIIVTAIPIFMEVIKGNNNTGVFVSNITMLLTVILFYFIYAVIGRQRGEIVEENTELNQALTSIRGYYWHKLWFWLAWATAIFNLLIYVSVDNVAWYYLVTLIYTVLILVLCIGTEMKVRIIQQNLTKETGKDAYIDEDEYWILGMIYYNPNDKHFMINDRIGMGTSINVGKKSGMIVMVVSLLIILMLPLIGIWMIYEENKPLDIEVTQDYIYADEYEIPIDDIVDISLWEELPETHKRVGTGLDTLYSGSFSVGGDLMDVLIDPSVPPYIWIQTEDDEYLINTRDSQETIDLYEEIIE